MQQDRVDRILSYWAGNSPNATALSAPDASPLTYSRLAEQVDMVRRALRRIGIGRDDAVAVALGNGPEMAVASLAVLCACGCAPLNPSLRRRELGFCLDDLGVLALVVDAGSEGAARDLARQRGIPVLEVVRKEGAEAGAFSLHEESSTVAPAGGALDARRVDESSADDIALLLHTSGTTSRPKLVPLRHRNLCASAKGICETLQLSASDSCLNIMPLFHIHGLATMLASLAAGGSVICTPGFYAPEFFGWLRRHRPTWYSAVPTMHQAILRRAEHEEEPLQTDSLRLVRSSSSPLSPKLMRELQKLFGVPVVEAYGMTEASHQIASNPLPPGLAKPGSVGIATGSQIAIMSPQAETLDTPGATGEIVIRGENVTSGYCDCPEDNASAVKNGWFHTGDLGFLDEDGYLHISGRIKEIINRGGEKIAPGEVEEVLLDHPDVVQAAVFAMPDRTLGEEVAAAVVLRQAGSSERSLRRFAAERLADFKIPRRIVIVDEIPTTATGKATRAGLARRLGIEGELVAGAGAANDDPPRDAFEHEGVGASQESRQDYEEALERIWREVLKIPKLGAHESFIELGGDSMLAALIAARVKQRLGRDISIVEFFDAPTVAEHAALLEAHAKPKETAHGVRAEGAGLPHFPRQSKTPLSFIQQRLWFLSQYAPEEPTFNRPLAIRFRGSLDRTALERGLKAIVARHDVFRSRVRAEDGVPFVVTETEAVIELEHLKLHAMSQDQSEAAARRVALNEARRPFDLSCELPIRAKLLRLAEDDHVLCLTIHHIAFDGWSEGVLFRELGAVYERFAAGDVSPLPELSHRYSDFTLWQRGRLQGEVLDGALDFWTSELEGVPTVLSLPSDRPRPAVRRSAGSMVSLSLSVSLSQRLEALSRAQGATLFMTLLTAFEVLLYRYTQQEEFIVGCPTAGRPWVETEPLIGVFINTLALHANLSGNPGFDVLLARTREKTLAAFAHGDLPFEKLVDALRVERDPSRTPLFQVLFELRNFHARATDLEGISLERFDFDTGIAQQDLALDIRSESDGLHFSFKYSTDLFEEASIRRMAEHYRTLLEGLTSVGLERPISELPLLTPQERKQLIEWNRTVVDLPRDRCVHECFEERVAHTPDAVALRFGNDSMTYGELNARANQVAHRLRKLGVQPDEPVAICMRRSADMLVGVLGILKAGAAYLALDPEHPAARQRYMLEDAGAPVVVTQNEFCELSGYGGVLLPIDAEREHLAREPITNPQTITTPDSLMYLMYTSGSTGDPKGVLISHANVLNYISFERQTYRFSSDDCVLLTSSLAWDASTDDIFATFLSGATLVVPSEEEAKEPDSLLRLIDHHGISVLPGVVPSLGRALAAAAGGRAEYRGTVRLFISVGEALQPADVRLIREAFGVSMEIFNHYGCTECTGAQVYFPVTEVADTATSVPIGRPTPNHQVFILDPHQTPVPVGVPGEIYIGGAGLARGYHKRPELTAERFVAHPVSNDPEARVYRTGDRGRFLADGNIEHLGRLDHQVKIRGFRVEPGEVEFSLRAHPSVSNVIVEDRPDHLGNSRLVAYVVARDRELLVTELRDFLSRRLPSFMVPSTFVFLEGFHFTPNGKLDRSKLPDPDVTRPSLREAYAEPRDDDEQKLVAIWSELLGLERIGIHDDFFDLGGHSLLAFQVINRVRDAFGVDLPVHAVFLYPTPAGLLAAVRDSA